MAKPPLPPIRFDPSTVFPATMNGVPITSASKLRPSASVMAISSAPAMTWLLVRTNPSLSSTMTPEPRLCEMRSRGLSGMLKKRRKNGSSISGLRTRTRVCVYTLTTDGVTFSSTGASDGRDSPSTTAGSAAMPASAANSRNNRKSRFISRTMDVCTRYSPFGGSLAIWRKTGYIAIRVK